jgi:tetratricopeptide (TPR) repeat protein
VSSETFTGELSYCLGRIAAETGRFEDCRTLYLEAVTAEPELGTNYPGRTSRARGAEFENMGRSMLERYEKYKKRVEELIRADANRKAKPRKANRRRSVSGQTLKVVQGFVLNDYGNACLRHFHQHGAQTSLEKAIEAYRKAGDMNPLDARPWLNLQNAYVWNNENDEADKCFEQAGELSPGWTSLVISAAVERVRRCATELRRAEAALTVTEEHLSGTAAEPQREDRKWRELDRDEEQNRVEECEEKLSQAKDQAFNKMRETSRFAGILAAEGIGILEQARWLTSIPWNKLEERDVELQIRLAELLGIRANAEELEAAEMLWSRLFEMLPEDHEVVSGLLYVTRKMWKARIVFGAIKRLGFDSASKEINEFAQLSWRELDERKIDILFQLADLFNPSKLGPNKFPRQTATVLLALLFGMPAQRQELAHGLSVWETQWRAGISAFVGKSESLELARTRRLFHRAVRQYLKIVLGWLRSETRTFLAHWWIAELARRQKSWVNRQAEKIKGEFFGDARIHLRKETEGWVSFRQGKVYFRQDKYEAAQEFFFDAIKNMPRESGYHHCLGLCREQLRDWHGALTAYQEACRLAPDNLLYRQVIGSVYNQVGDTNQRYGEYADAMDKYGNAVRQTPGEAIYHRNLALALERAELPEPQAATEKACQEMHQAASLAPGKQDYQQELRRMETRRVAYQVYGSVHIMKFYTAVTTLAVEYGAELEPFIGNGSGSETSADLRRRYKDLHRRIWHQFGVNVPLARWRQGNLQPHEYLVMFNEVPLLPLGEVRPERKFCPNPPWTARDQILRPVWRTDMKHDPFTGNQEDPRAIPARDPLTGNEGAWIGERALDPKILKELELHDALDFVLRHLEAIIRSRLPQFLTHDDVVDRLRRSSQRRVQSITDSPEQVKALTDLLKAMLAERAPIKPFDELCWHFFKRSKETIEEMRMVEEIRQELWGNSEDFSPVPVSKNVEALVNDNLQDTGKTLVLALDVQPRKRLLSAVVTGLERVHRPVLVVEEPRVRVFLRRLIEAEFPEVPVLARRELRAERSVNRDRLIDLA